MIELLCLFLPCLPATSSPSVRLHGIASTYHGGDAYTEGKYFGCYKESKRLLGSPKFRDDLPTVAHRTLPCGTLVRIQYLGKKTLAIVLDRGPWGAMKEGKWILKKRAEATGTWRGILDLTRRTKQDLDFSGYGTVTVDAFVVGSKQSVQRASIAALADARSTMRTTKEVTKNVRTLEDF